ncbi:MAG: FkbM family methyltransferase [Cytophagales bacterium]|nr:FkbM family methyltransferase [Cytophagales bacterium]
MGWVRSLKENESVDMDGNPIPWNSYAFIDFIRPRLHDKLSMFEYGCGNSTLFYSKLVGSITSVESDLNWYNRIKALAPENSTIIFESLEKGHEGYVKTVQNTQKKFDIISVDAYFRSECVEVSINSLTDTGVLVLDDTNTNYYESVLGKLQDAGFKRIDFWGLSPLVKDKKATSIFYRKENVLNI